MTQHPAGIDSKPEGWSCRNIKYQRDLKNTYVDTKIAIDEFQ